MNRRMVILFLATGAILLSACGDIVKVAQTKADAERITAQGEAAQAEAERLAAETTRAQAAAQARTTQALIDAQNARIDDYRAILILAFVLAALAMGLSIALAFALRRAQVQVPRITYQLMPPQMPQQTQIGTPDVYLLPEERAKQRALQAANEGRKI